MSAKSDLAKSDLAKSDMGPHYEMPDP